MAKLDFLLQAVTARFHAEELRKILSQSECKKVLASVAFVLKDGVDSIAPQLKAVANVSTFFIGIRNDITSIQAVKRLLELGVRVFAVDTASRSTLFHPKLFIAVRKSDAKIIIGSANMTFSGLHNNVEAGAIVDLDLTTKDDKNFLENLIKTVEEMPSQFPDNVFQIKNVAAAEALFDEGRLLDEDVVRAPLATAVARKGMRDSLKAMKLARHTPPKRKRSVVKEKTKIEPTAADAIGVVPTQFALNPDFTLVWESEGLKERDLNIPSGQKTNPTGSMLWKKGAAEGIDQRHFFRDEVFADLDWQVDPKLTHYERAYAKFQIVIKGLNYGVFELKLSHNTKKDTKTYAEKNSMTSIHWGSVLKLVAKSDLLGRIMSLYRKEGNPPEFLIKLTELNRQFLRVRLLNLFFAVGHAISTMR